MHPAHDNIVGIIRKNKCENYCQSKQQLLLMQQKARNQHKIIQVKKEENQNKMQVSFYQKNRPAGTSNNKSGKK